MTLRQNGERNPLLDVDPATLSRQELIDLARALQKSLAEAAPSRSPDAGGRPRPPAKPVPGADYTIVFDGGALGNPGRGYGSYTITSPSGVIAERQLEFGDQVTNNQAEFRTLIGALEDLLQRLGPKARSHSIAIRGDSQLVIRGLTGEWKVKHPGLQPLHRQASELLRQFASVDLAWHPRRESVRTFGH